MQYFSRLSALRRGRLFTSTDTDETRERVGQILQPHELVQFNRYGGRRSHLDTLRLRGLSLNAVYYGDAEVHVPALDAYDFICCLRGAGEIRNQDERQRISAQRAVLCRPGSALAETLPGCEILVIRIRPDAIEPYLDAELGQALPSVVDLSRPCFVPWMSMVQALISDQNIHVLMADRPALATEYEGAFLRMMLAAMASDRELATPLTAAPGTVRRAEAYMAAYADEALTLPQIASVCGVSPRTLHRTFRRFRNCSPMERLRDMRLNRAYELLQSADCESNIAQIAMTCGFGHLGRFSGSYLARFRERPSDTLRRSRVRGGSVM